MYLIKSLPAVVAVAAQNQDFHAEVNSSYGIPERRPGSWQKVVATDAVVATDEGTADVVMAGEEKPGCLAVAEDVVTPCSAVRNECLAPAAGQVLEFVTQNDGDMSESCAAAAVVAVEVVVEVVAAAVVEDAAAVEDMVEVGDLRLW